MLTGAAAGAVVLIVGAALFPILRGGRPSLNPIQSLANGRIQAALNDAVASNLQNGGIEATAYFRETPGSSVIVFDLKGVEPTKTRLDVFRLFLDFADQAQAEPCDTVELAFRGRTKFQLEGSYFRRLGRDRNVENPVYTVRTFPENLLTPSGSRAYPEWTGGLLGIFNKQMEDANDFHDKWYLDELAGY